MPWKSTAVPRCRNFDRMGVVLRLKISRPVWGPSHVPRTSATNFTVGLGGGGQFCWRYSWSLKAEWLNYVVRRNLLLGGREEEFRLAEHLDDWGRRGTFRASSCSYTLAFLLQLSKMTANLIYSNRQCQAQFGVCFKSVIPVRANTAEVAWRLCCSKSRATNPSISPLIPLRLSYPLCSHKIFVVYVIMRWYIHSVCINICCVCENADIHPVHMNICCLCDNAMRYPICLHKYLLFMW
jgi:hypothetical protein